MGKLSNHLREAAGALSDDNPTKALLLTKAEDLLRDDYLKRYVERGGRLNVSWQAQHN